MRTLALLSLGAGVLGMGAPLLLGQGGGAEVPVSIVTAVERLGGWAVVVWIVWWLTKRWEAKMADIVEALASAQEATASVLASQNLILHEIREDQHKLIQIQAEVHDVLRRLANHQEKSS